MRTILYSIMLIMLPITAHANKNTTIDSFSKAKKLLETQVYHDHRETIYCAASFDSKKKITPPQGFTTTKYIKRSAKVEWEHVVPAENFGKAFTEWRNGHEQCVNTKGKAFKGRRCTEKMNEEYRHMQADLYNLFPAIGAVNAMRSNYNFVASVNDTSDFGSCAMKIDNKKAEPPTESKGRIARAYLYMQDTYPQFKMGSPQQKLMVAWDKMYPVSDWECKRASRIESIQGNINQVLKTRCTGNQLISKN